VTTRTYLLRWPTYWLRYARWFVSMPSLAVMRAKGADTESWPWLRWRERLVEWIKQKVEGW